MEGKNIVASVYKPVNAKMIKRLAAFIIDAILLLIVSTGILYICSVSSYYDTHYDNLHNQYREIGYEIYDEENKTWKIIDENYENFEDIIKEYNNNEIIKKENEFFSKFVLNAPLLSITISLLILEIIIPLILKNGQTIGMKCFSIALISTSEIKVKPLQIFIRGLFGKIVLLGLIPYMCLIYSFFNPTGGLLGTIFFLLINIINLIFLFSTPNKTAIPDKIGQVFAVDATSTIFFNSLKDLHLARSKERKSLESNKKVY
ncbi:MAG: RDD family protein [Erysipelotrichaceae bacterium]|nr:RDD family protein [Erysipelotrichaceae bacterium]